MKKRFLYLIVPFFTLLLEILPYGAVCIFKDDADSVLRKTFSYFSLIPYGYANFAPFITAVLTCIEVVLLVLYCVTGKLNFAKKAKLVLVAAIIISFAPLMLGFEYFSAVGLLISISLVAEMLLLHFMLHNSETLE